MEPLSRRYGYDRGTPVDRVYIHRFLEVHRGDIRGHVLDVGDDIHSRRFGGTGLERVDVLHPIRGHPGATLAADLETGEGFPRDTFDCFLLLETLQLIYNLERAVQVAHDAVKPGGVVLATADVVTPKEPDWPDYWRLTSASMRRLFEERFGAANIEVAAFGNVLTASAFLYGAAAEELDRRAFDHHDPGCEVVVGVRARRAPG